MIIKVLGALYQERVLGVCVSVREREREKERENYMITCYFPVIFTHIITNLMTKNVQVLGKY
jgi:hypothetical protein